MLSIVLDTNILVSALLVRQSIPDRIVRLAGNKIFQTRYSDDILREYIAVLSRKKFNFRLEDIERIITGIMNAGMPVNPVPSACFMADEADRKFYDAAQTAGAILITGNGKHYPSEPFIFSPAEFMRRYGG
ncbi:MAG: putative toxin-antitoxin system toxin component, PIN family [Treponema sp.]|jgi:putative PIN family toxin of toxin-antitoxin system|nr:putative toxin-antitoxin system toxin component, PIN family [Treponema sp.]